MTTHLSPGTMNRAIRALTIVGLSVMPAALSAQTAKDSVVAVVNEFFRAMTARDTAATRRVQLADGISYAVRSRADSAVVSRGEFEGWVRQLATMRDTLVERMWQPTVMVHGPIATVWAPYDIHRNRQFVHCGVDAFTLIRGSSGWKIATVTYTAEPTGCAPSPLGPLK
jgi:hypothetical protein